MTIEYTYTTYQQPQFVCDISLLYDLDTIIVTELRKRAVIANEITQFFWCNFTPEAYGVCFLLHTVPTEGEPDNWFGLCEAGSEYQHITSIRTWHVNLEKTQGLQWFSYACGVKDSGTPYEERYKYNNGDEHAFGYGYDTGMNYIDPDHHEINPSRRKILFGFHQDKIDINPTFEPTFILPPKSILLEGMHVDTCGVNGNIPLYDDMDNQQYHWNYKEIAKATETGN